MNGPLQDVLSFGVTFVVAFALYPALIRLLRRDGQKNGSFFVLRRKLRGKLCF